MDLVVGRGHVRGAGAKDRLNRFADNNPATAGQPQGGKNGARISASGDNQCGQNVTRVKGARTAPPSDPFADFGVARRGPPALEAAH